MRKLTEVLRQRSVKEDLGSTLVTVLIVMLVLTIGGVAIAGIVTSTTGSLSKSGTFVQAQATVDAGIAEQTARIEQGLFAGCATEPGFWPDQPDPVNASATVKEFAPGEEDPRAMYEVRSGDQHYFYRFSCSAGDAVLEVTAAQNSEVSRLSKFSYVVQHEVKAPALITKKTITTGVLSGITADNPDEMADLWVLPDGDGSGNFNCGVAGVIDGSVYVANGNISATAICNLKGALVASGNINLTAAVTAGGDVISQNGSVNLTAAVNVKGSIYAKGDITIAAGATIAGDVVSTNGKVTFLGIASVGGSVHAKKNIGALLLVNVKGDAVSEEGTVSTFLATVRGNRISNSGEPTPEIPEITYEPKWRSITNADIDKLTPKAAGTPWGGSPGGFNYVKWDGNCSFTSLLGSPGSSHALQRMGTYTQPTLIDARHCTSGVKLSRPLTGIIFPHRLYLKTDIMIVAPSFNWQAVRFSSGDGARHKLWFISPDEACAASDFGAIAHGVEIDTAITPMLYTNCSASFSLLGLGRWHGSMAVNDFSGLPSFRYRPSGFPGWDEEIFDSATGTVATWELTETRDVE